MVLIAHETIDSRMKSSTSGILYKFDIEKANNYGHWGFILAIMENMGFGQKWISWIKWYISSTRFLVLLSETLVGFFESLRGLSQGDSLSPYLFIFPMEALSCFSKKARDGGSVSGFKVGGRGQEGEEVSHLLFADDTLIFCDASQEQLAYLSETFMWLEALS